MKIETLFDDLTRSLERRAPRSMNIRAIAVGGLLAAAAMVGPSPAEAQSHTRVRGELPEYIRQAAIEAGILSADAGAGGEAAAPVRTTVSMGAIVRNQLAEDVNAWVKGVGGEGARVRPADLERLRMHHESVSRQLRSQGHGLAVIDVARAWAEIGRQMGREGEAAGEAMDWLRGMDNSDARVNEAYVEMAQGYRPHLAQQAAKAQSTAQRAGIERRVAQEVRRDVSGRTNRDSGILGRVASMASSHIEESVRDGSYRRRQEADKLERDLNRLDNEIDRAWRNFRHAGHTLEDRPPEPHELRALLALSEQFTRGGASRTVR